MFINQYAFGISAGLQLAASPWRLPPLVEISTKYTCYTIHLLHVSLLLIGSCTLSRCRITGGPYHKMLKLSTINYKQFFGKKLMELVHCIFPFHDIATRCYWIQVRFNVLQHAQESTNTIQWCWWMEESRWRNGGKKTWAGQQPFVWATIPVSLTEAHLEKLFSLRFTFKIESNIWLHQRQ